MQAKKTYKFSAILESVKRNRVTSAVFLPHHIIIDLPKGRLRVTGIINGEPFSQAIQSRRDGSRFFTVGAALRKATRLEPGDQAQVSFRILETKAVDLPDNFECVTSMESETRRANQRSKTKKNSVLSHYADSIRNLDSRVRKAFEIVQRSRSIPRAQEQKRNSRKK